MNWSYEAISLLFASIPFYISFIVLFMEYIRYKDRSLFFLMWNWMIYGLYWQVEALSYILLLPALFLLRSVFLFMQALCTSLALDHMDKDSIDPFKIGMFSALGGVTVFSAFLPSAYEDYTYPNGDQSYSTSGFFFVFMLLMMVLIITVYLFFMIKIYRKAPSSLKGQASFNVLGSIIVGPVAIILYALRISLIVPGIIAIASAAGAIITSITFARHPELAYVLPSKAIKLAILHRDTSYLQFMHNWVKRTKQEYDLEDQIFTGIMQSIIKLLHDMTQHDVVREVKMEENMLLIYRSNQRPYIIVLLATTLTRSLRNSFSHFVNKYHQLTPSAGKEDESSTLEALVSTCFPYVPSYASDEVKPKIFQKEIQPQEKEDAEKHDNLPPISSLCISCHDIKDTSNNWQELVSFYQQQSGTRLAWDICPRCSNVSENLILSYFDVILGPTVLVTIPENVKTADYTEISFILDSDSDGFFIKVIQDNFFANYKFQIKIESARGGLIFLALSYSTSASMFDQTFAETFLRSIVDEILTGTNLEALFMTEKKVGALNHRRLEENEEFKKIKLILEKNFTLIPTKKIHHYIEKQIQRTGASTRN
ncbi:MAG: hypothetical protein ACFFCS_02165 [Candidatus Hodarchaeota archaeon]